MPDGVGAVGTGQSGQVPGRIPPFPGSKDRVPGTAPKAQAAKKDSSADKAEAADVEKLRARDQDVRAHEAAHLAAAGGLARGGASFTYEKGPDGRLYAIGGEVDIDTSPVSGDPAATLAKARRIQAAALAPADPSPQDRAVASAAAALASQAAQALAKQPPGGAQVGTKVDQEA